jgi:outer membrane protein assembly factor BamB
VSSRGTNVYGKEGSILYYNIDTTNNRLTVWNSTKASEEGYSGMRNYYWCWRPFVNATFDGNNGFSLNVSIPEVSGSIRAVREGEFIIGGTAGANNPDEQESGNLWCLSLEPGQEGTLLWDRTFTPPYSVIPAIAGGSGFGAAGMTMGTVDPEDGVFFFEQKMTRERWCYSLETGEELWKSEPEASMNYYGMSDSIYDGKLLSYGYSGELIAYDIPTGEALWTYTAEQEGYESPYGNYPIGVSCIADGKVYLTSSEHSPTQPLWRGSRIRCIDVSNGEELWTINHWGMGMGAGSGVVIADGYLVGLNAYDNQIYCYGMGPSATKVTAAPKIVAKGSSVLIEGTVTDQSSGAKSREVMAKSPNEEGIPCISDEYMTEWMEYLYMDQGIPGDATGVEVTLDAIDPNGNFVHIDTVRSDMSGMFKKKWTPDTEGEYTIIATFEGSKSYWASYAETTIGVDPAAAPSGPIEPEPTEPTEAPLITTEVAILIAAVIVAVAVIAGFWILRKRK